MNSSMLDLRSSWRKNCLVSMRMQAMLIMRTGILTLRPISIILEMRSSQGISTMNLPISVRYRPSASLNEEEGFDQLMSASSAMRVSSAMRMSLTSGGLMVAIRKLQGFLKISFWFMRSSCFTFRITIYSETHWISGLSNSVNLPYISRVISRNTVPSLTLPTLPDRWIMLAWLVNLVQSRVTPLSLEEFLRVSAKSTTTLQKGSVMLLQPMLVARISLFAIFGLKRLWQSSSENSEWTQMICDSEKPLAMRRVFMALISKSPGRKTKQSPSACDFRCFLMRSTAKLYISSLMRCSSSPQQKSFCCSSSKNTSSTLNCFSSCSSSFSAGLNSLPAGTSSTSSSSSSFLPRPLLPSRLAFLSFSSEMQKLPCESLQKYWQKRSAFSVADMTTNLTFCLYLPLMIRLRATKVKSISRDRSCISSSRICVQGRFQLKRSCWMRIPQVMQMMLQ